MQISFLSPKNTEYVTVNSLTTSSFKYITFSIRYINYLNALFYYI